MKDNKRMTIRLVTTLAEKLSKISKQRGVSINALITEMAWQFVSEYQRNKQKGI